MKRWYLGLLAAAILLLAGCAHERIGEEYGQMNMKDAAAAMAGDSGYILLDVRTREEYEQGHIPGAVNLPNEEIGETQPSLLPDQEQTIYIYCRSGRRSKQAAENLSQLGYTNLIEIGGIMDWDGEIER